jgi:nucleoside phosphorylase
MLLIAAAMKEELEIGMNLCRELRKIPNDRGVRLWQAMREDKSIGFLKAGVGPKQSAASLEAALKVIQPSHILIVGYAGAIDPALKLGNLVAVSKALAFRLDKNNPDWSQVQLEGEFVLTHGESLAQKAKSAGLDACIGDSLTSPYVLGNPVHKNLLYEKFHASIVDMETAALARAAVPFAIPVSCIRAISDEAQDTFLEPFSYDPLKGVPARAKKLLNTGMVQTYREWKEHAAVAKQSLNRFLSCYL